MLRCAWQYKLALFSVYAVTYCVFYIYPNVRPWSSPEYLSMLPLDLAIPFVPWTFAIYLSDYLLALVTIIILDDVDSFNSYSRMCFTGLIICGGFFFFLPTSYPRPPYPEVSNPLIAGLMQLVNVADTPNNCFPSMHVAMTGIAVWSVRGKGLKLFWGLPSGRLRSFSTLTTKQHYFVDILAGDGVAASVAYFDHWVVAKGYVRALRERLSLRRVI